MQIRRIAVLLVGGALLPLLWSCIEIRIPGEDVLFVKGEPFIVSGVSAVVDEGGPCRVWYASNGMTYELFQGARVDNTEFDQIMTPGRTSRLEIATRSDLESSCDVGRIVEVQRILEIVE